VTGGARGIGAGIARHLGRQGANVVVTYTSESSEKLCSALLGELPEKGLSIRADMTELETPSVVVKKTVDAFGRIDIIVNNAAIAELAPLDKLDLEHYNRTFDGNVRGVIFLIKEALPHLQKGGRIINISSEGARLGRPGGTCYSASKAAMESYTRSWAAELGQTYGVTVNALAVGLTDTDLFHKLPDAAKRMLHEDIIKKSPAEGRIGTVDDVAQVVGFLASEASRWVTGQTISVTGGNLMI